MLRDKKTCVLLEYELDGMFKYIIETGSIWKNITCFFR